MKRLLLIWMVLVAAILLPLNICQAASHGKVSAGYYYNGVGEGVFAVSMGQSNIFIEQAGLCVSNYTGIFHASTDDDVQGASTFMICSKSWHFSSSPKSTQFYVAFGTGMLWDIKDAEDKLDADIKTEVGVKPWPDMEIGVGYDYIPKTGPDAYFLYGSINIGL